MEATRPDPTDAVIAEAEAVLRGAADGVEQLLDACELPLRLASEQLQGAADAAEKALGALHGAAQAYAALQAEAARQVAALSLSAARWPGDIPLDTGIDDTGLLILRGRCYAGHPPTEILLRTLLCVLNEQTGLPAGTRVELHMRRFVEGGE